MKIKVSDVILLWVRNHCSSFWLQSQKYTYYEKSLSFSPPWPLFNYFSVVPFQVLQYKGNNGTQQSILKRAAKVTKGVEHSHEERLRKLRLLDLKRRPRRDLVIPYKFLNGGCKTIIVRLFSMVHSERIRGSKGQKLKHRRLPLNIKKEIFSESSPGKSEIIRRISHLCWKQWRNYSSCLNHLQVSLVMF